MNENKTNMNENKTEINRKIIDYYLYNIDIEILRILNKNEGIFINYYKIYNEIIINMHIYEDLINDFNCIFIFYLIRMHVINEKVFIHVEQYDEIKFEYYLCINKSDESNERIDDETYNFKNKELDLPSSYEALCYFIDNSIRKYINYLDYEGNNIIHILAMNSDNIRLSKVLYRYQHLFLEMNNYYETPIDLITDIKISNLFTRILLESCCNKNNEIAIIKNDNNQMKIYILLFALSYGIFYIISNIFIVSFN
jgi:hypothetical protein